MDKKDAPKLVTGGIIDGVRKVFGTVGEQRETIIPLSDWPFNKSHVVEKLEYLDRLTKLRDGSRLPELNVVEDRIANVCDSIEKELGLSKENSQMSNEKC